MNKTLLIAKREFLQIVRTKSFILTLLIMPAMLVLSPLLASFSRTQAPGGYVMVDQTGRFGAAVEQRLERGHQREVLEGLARYAQRNGVKSKTGTALWDQGPRDFTDQDVDAFAAAGGVKAALADMGPLPDGAPPYVALKRQTYLVQTPADIPADKDVTAFGKAASEHFSGARKKGLEPLRAAVFIPADYGKPGVAASVFTSGDRGVITETVQEELNAALRSELAVQAGVPPETSQKLQTAQADVKVVFPKEGGRDRQAIRSALPLAMSYLLLMTLFVSGVWLLQGVLEEKANKLLEAVLACVTPSELMHGKLIGIVAVGLLVIVVWSLCVVGLVTSLPGGIGAAIRPALAALNSPLLPFALLFYFLAGYLMMAMIYLTVGSLAETMQDAQAYIAPLSLMLFLPFMVLTQLIGNPDALGPRVLSWIPIYTPFAMMARLGTGVEPYELIGTAALLIAFITAEFILLGRLFKARILRTGQSAKPREFFKLLLRPTA